MAKSAHQTLGVVEKLCISRLIQPQRQLRRIAGQRRLAEGLAQHVVARVAGLMDDAWNAYAVSRPHAVDVPMLAGEPAIQQQAAERAQVGVRVIGFGGRVDGAIRSRGLGKVILRDPIRQPQRRRIAGGLEEPNQSFQQPSMRVAGIGVVDDRLAAFSTGVELLQIPTSIVAEFAVETLDHLSPHRGGPVVSPPPRKAFSASRPSRSECRSHCGPSLKGPGLGLRQI